MKSKLRLLFTLLLISLFSRTYSQVYIGSFDSDFPLTSDSINIPNSFIGLWIDKDLSKIDSELSKENNIASDYVFETYMVVNKINDKFVQIELLDKQDESHRYLSIYQGFISNVENNYFLNLRKIYYNSDYDLEDYKFSDYYISKISISDGYFDSINIDSRKECSSQSDLLNFFKLNLTNSFFYSDTQRFYKLY